ncbi:uncharacterized protein LOC111917420 [Lactuca sativa]|uniref:uncharacterized protein LOC111917420 n=1 Tax=Lactuca sativa TaxID=4236 RepID=UPI0022B029C1|nr:uncharacterized protein LOC111917420 [Lactuca sativa]
MDPFDLSDDSDDNIFFRMMYHYYTTDLLQPDLTPLLTRRAMLNRNRKEGHEHLYRDYFADNCVYGTNDFKRRFRLSTNVFLRIANALESRYKFFQLRYDARGRRGFTTLQKCVAAIRLMAMGESPDTTDDYMRMSERTARESLYTLSRGVVETFGDVYLRKPSLHDLQELYAAHEEHHGFPGMIGSIDCTHWKWKNCPVACSNNDVNILDQSPIFDDLLNGKASDAPFTVNGNEYKYGYYLTDGIYPQYSIFVKGFRHPVEERDNFFKRRQEGARKDVERAFGVLKAK